MKSLLNFSLAIISVCSVYSQKLTKQDTLDQRPLSLQKEFYIQGDAMTIGNNILSAHAEQDYNEYGIMNDKIKMKYVDIDNENSTFSSSSAELILPPNSKKIKHAALYWSSTYGFEKGHFKIVKNQMVVKGNGKRDSVLNIIKFKTPNQEYKTIHGELVFDGHQKKLFNANSPYLCYADVTSLLQNNQRNGYYTVANIKATEGVITGGSSAGWILFVVFEQENVKPKYISTYHGISLLFKKPFDIKFKNFMTQEVGQVNASISMAAIEGDAKIKTDKCSVFSHDTNTFVNMSSKFRPELNFFNSKITNNEDHVENRVPKSENTLGFDLVEFDLPNTNNVLLDNNQSELDFKVFTKADRFYLFFTAFKTDISESCYLEHNIENNENIVSTDILKDANPVTTNVDEE